MNMQEKQADIVERKVRDLVDAIERFASNPMVGSSRDFANNLAADLLVEMREKHGWDMETPQGALLYGMTDALYGALPKGYRRPPTNSERLSELLEAADDAADTLRCIVRDKAIQHAPHLPEDRKSVLTVAAWESIDWVERASNGSVYRPEASGE